MQHGGLETGFLLDRRWHWMRSEVEQDKKPALLFLGRVLAEVGVPYAIIGGVALQVHQEEPRTTLDIDFAVLDRARIPRERLAAAGFEERVQFTDDPALASAIGRAEPLELEGVALRIITRADLLREKLRAASDPARRRSKRIQDLADAQSLLEADASLAAGLTPAEMKILQQLPV